MKIIFFVYNVNVPFVINELMFMLNSEKIKCVELYTYYPLQDSVLARHEKIKVNIGLNKTTNKRSIMKLIWLTFIYFKELILNLWWYLRTNSIVYNFYVLLQKDNMSDVLLEDRGIGCDEIYYSYWASSDALTLALLKIKNKEIFTITRLHGFDLYEGGNNNGHIPWRDIVYEKIDRLITISDHGKKYLEGKYSFTAVKISTHKLGIYLNNNHISFSGDNQLSVISCSRVGNHKNLKGIFNALKSQSDITWCHLGDGEDFEELKNHVFNSDGLLKVIFKGRMTQEDIFNYYKSEKISCFISLSPNEGLPVSMMEAMAFGIPIVSTNVGGCSEIVNENTGVLLPDNYTDQDVIDAIKLCAEKFSSYEARKRIQDECKEKFDAKKNYDKFIDFLIEENNKFHKKRKNEEL